jgi:hypothetical protein
LTRSRSPGGCSGRSRPPRSYQIPVDGLLEAAEAEIGTDGLLSGWALVAALLRKLLVDHADQVGCDCGSAEWLEETQLHYAGLPDHTHDDDEM